MPQSKSPVRHHSIEEVKPVMKVLGFNEITISREIRKAIEDMGFEEATPIQAQSIPVLLQGKDVIGQAQTGTGKTAAFGIPILEMVESESKKTQAIILCPTRELAVQVAEEMKKIARYKKGIEILPIYGGQPIDRQIKGLKRGVQIIIGTPGRVMDHMERRTLKLENVKIVVLDEADEMLDMGFREDIETILKKVPAERQTVLFSATMPKSILDLTHRFQKNPQFIKVVHKELTVPSIEQFYLEVKEHSKAEILARLIDAYNLKLSLVFCNTKRKVDELAASLQARGYSAEGLHGDMNQSQRDRVMAKFRKGIVEILVATDVAARGIDVEDIEAVFNYDVPQDEEYYVHRIGRTGRAGKTGRAFTLAVGRDTYKIRDIQKYANTKIKSLKVPSVTDVEERKTGKLLEQVKNTINEGHLGKYVHLVEGLLEEDYTSLDVAAGLLKVLMGEENKEKPRPSSREEKFGDTGASHGMVRLFINAGKNQKVRPGDILGSIAGETGIPGEEVGAIDIYDKFSFVEVPEEYANDVISGMKGKQIKGTKVSIEPAGNR